MDIFVFSKAKIVFQNLLYNAVIMALFSIFASPEYQILYLKK